MTQPMKIRVAVAAGLALPAAMAWGQMTGTSHPDDVTVTTSEQGVRQPVVYRTSAQAAAPAVSAGEVEKAPAAPTFVLVGSTADVVGGEHHATFDPDAHVVGDSPESMPRPQGSAPLLVRGGGPVSEDMTAGVVMRVEGPSNGLPVGTIVRTRLLTDLSTKASVPGTEWQAELLEPLMRDGRVLIPAGAVIRGKVTEVHGGRRISGEASLHLLPLAVTMPDGTQLGMHAQVIDTNLFRTTKVDDEGTILRRDHKKEDASILALTAGSGAVAGAVLAGPPGALIGAGVGAGVSTAFWLRQDRQAELPRNTRITFELTTPMVLGGA